ncbi:basic proline-rich protein-like [Sus scrofa]|uniref:basic proline-rich protein-like n=1 Tax=Sus scrofa TaxID=9823 RepID=UPI0006B23473|nr:basic proline-rich protein-like [Sus scrofa]
MAAWPGAQGRAGGLEPVEGVSGLRSALPALETSPARPPFPAPPTRKPAVRSTSPSPLFSLQERGGGARRPARTPPRRVPGPGLIQGRPLGPGLDAHPGPASPQATFPWALTTAKNKCVPRSASHPSRASGTFQSCKVARASGAAGERSRSSEARSEALSGERLAIPPNTPTPEPERAPRPHLGSPRLCAALPPRLRGSLAAPPGSGPARRAAPPRLHPQPPPPPSSRQPPSCDARTAAA